MNEDGYCTKKYKKEFREQTQANSDGYPEYRRPDNGATFITNKGVYEEI